MWSTIFAAGVGALIANFLAEFIKSLVRRSQLGENQRDQDLQAIISLADALRDDAQRYWLSGADHLGDDEIIISARIVAAQQSINDLLATLLKAPGKYQCDVLMVNLQDAVSGGDFGVSTRQREAERLMSIHHTATMFKHEATRQRRLLPRNWLA